MKSIIYFFFLSLLFSCGNFSDQSAPQATKSFGMNENMEMDEAPPETPPQQIKEQDDATPDAIPREKKIIKDGDMRLEVDDIKKAKLFVDSTLKKYNAYYEKEIFESSDYQSSYHLKIRVPAKNFDNLVNATSEQKGDVQLKNINARDVTEQFYDIKTRLENNESYLSQYRNLLKRANSIKEILEVQEKIRVLEEEIESKKGRLKYLSDQVSFSTLNLTLVEKHEWQKKNKKGFGEKIIDALKDGGGFFADFVLLVLRLWPFLILTGVIVFLVRRWRRVKKEKTS